MHHGTVQNQPSHMEAFGYILSLDHLSPLAPGVAPPDLSLVFR